jgi:SAM-dependent methyltransferase
VGNWSREAFVNSGLNSSEKALLDKVPFRQGRLLLLGVGGGREAIPLARLGFDVTGVDFVPDMIRRAKENASLKGLEIAGIVQELSRLDVPQCFYDVAWLSAGMYSSVPTSKRRIEMLKRIWKALRPGGYFVCEFHIGTGHRFSRKIELIRSALTLLTLGNFWYEIGDMLWAGREFMHVFSSEDAVKFEFEQGRFEVVHISWIKANFKGGAVLKKVAVG